MRDTRYEALGSRKAIMIHNILRSKNKAKPCPLLCAVLRGSEHGSRSFEQQLNWSGRRREDSKRRKLVFGSNSRYKLGCIFARETGDARKAVELLLRVVN